MAAWSIKESEV